MRTNILKFLFIVAIFAISQKFAYSQDNTGNVYEMNYLSIPYEQMSDFLKFYEEVGKPLDSQNEYIISVKVLTHVFGPAWNVCFLTEYKDLDAFVKARTRGDELFAKMFPDKSKMDEVGKKFASYLRSHTDAIVMDHPNLNSSKK